MSSASLAVLALLTTEPGAEEVNQTLSWTVGGTTLAILVGLLVALAAFGGGREHS